MMYVVVNPHTVVVCCCVRRHRKSSRAHRDDVVNVTKGSSNSAFGGSPGLGEGLELGLPPPSSSTLATAPPAVTVAQPTRYLLQWRIG